MTTCSLVYTRGPNTCVNTCVHSGPSAARAVPGAAHHGWAAPGKIFEFEGLKTRFCNKEFAHGVLVKKSPLDSKSIMTTLHDVKHLSPQFPIAAKINLKNSALALKVTFCVHTATFDFQRMQYRIFPAPGGAPACRLLTW